MSLTNTVPLGQAALDVLEVESLLTSAFALRQSTAPLIANLQAAQAAYEIEVLSRTPGVVGAISPLTVDAPAPR
jgi:hypothetical protein